MFFGAIASVTVVVIDTQLFSNLIGSDILFATSYVFSNYFIVALLASGFGETLAKNR